MTPEELKRRTKTFALRVTRLVEAVPRTRAGDAIARQLIKAGTSVAANYRAACRAKSNADFIAKMAIVEEEADEALFWMELIVEGGMLKESRVSSLMKEAAELLAIAVASSNTARGRPRGRGHCDSAVRRQSAIRNPQSAIG
jgi:four helix bundle protein